MRPPEAPRNMLLAMTVFAVFCVGLGVYPAPLYAILPFTVTYEPYTAAHLVAQFQLLLFAGLAFFVMLPMMKRTLTISLDFDWFYRFLFKHLGMAVVTQTSKARTQLENKAQASLQRLLNYLDKHHATGILSQNWPTGSMVLWIGVILGSYLLFDIVF